MLFTSSPGKPVGEPYINLASAWTVYPARPNSFPESEEHVPEAVGDTGEHLAVVELRHCTVERVEVLEPLPHLVLTFTDGRVLFLWGGHEQYESWQAGLACSGTDNWLVVAAPGGSLIAWAPDSYWAGAA